MATQRYPPPEKTANGPPPDLDWRRFYFGLHFAGFLATTLLMTWGLFALFFLALGGFSLDGLMHQLDNLPSRYVIATSDAGGVVQDHLRRRASHPDAPASSSCAGTAIMPPAKSPEGRAPPWLNNPNSTFPRRRLPLRA